VNLSRIISATLFAVVAGSIASQAAAQAEKLKLRLDWTAWGNHAAVFLAAQKDWFKQSNLEVEIEDGNGAVSAAQLVGAGNFDVGHASIGVMMMAHDKGLPVRAIASFYRRNDIGLLVPKGTIKSPTELAGKKLLFTASSIETPFIDSFLTAGGLTRSQVTLINVEASAKLSSYVTGGADGVFSTVPFVLPLTETTRPSDAILFSDYGLQFPSVGLFATDEKIKTRGPALRRFASVVSGAWQYIVNGGEEEAVQAIIAQRPEAKLNPKILRAQIDLIKTFFATPATKDMPMGLTAENDIAAAIKTMVAVKLIKGGKPSDYYTNDLLDSALIRKLGTR
jgi:NitT/TauT family transport system substrate-binding protein